MPAVVDRRVCKRLTHPRRVAPAEYVGRVPPAATHASSFGMSSPPARLHPPLVSDAATTRKPSSVAVPHRIECDEHDPADGGAGAAMRNSDGPPRQGMAGSLVDGETLRL